MFFLTKNSKTYRGISLKMSWDDFNQNPIFGIFVGFGQFLSLKVGWFQMENYQNCKWNEIGLVLAFSRDFVGICRNLKFLLKKSDVLEIFWVPIPHVVPRKQHVLLLGSFYGCIVWVLKMRKTHFSAFEHVGLQNLKASKIWLEMNQKH